MPLDSYISLGRSGLKVSPFCLGTMTFGEDWGWGCSPAVAGAILLTYIERGGNFVDTANNYTNGHSEKIIGDFFVRAGSRDRAVIATKFFSNLHFGDPNGGGAGRKAIIEQCNASLRRLQTDYIDLYWLHNWWNTAPIEETLRAMDDLVTAGKVRYLGISDTPAWKVSQAQTIAQFRGWAPLIAIQVEYSLLERTVEGELIPMALELGLGVLPWAPLKRGWLSGKYTRQNASEPVSNRTGSARPGEKEHAVIDVVRVVSAEQKTTPAAVALAWVQSQPGVVSTLIGARSIDQAHEDFAGLDLILTKEQLGRLDDISKPALNFPADFNRRFAPNSAFAGARVDGMATQVLPMMTVSSKRY